MAKNQANAKQHHETKPLLFENDSHSSSTLSSRNNGTYSKNYAKEYLCLHSRVYKINHNENDDENEKKIL